MLEETEGPEAPYKAIDQYLRGLKGHENLFFECRKYDSGWNINAFESSKEMAGVRQSSPESGGPLYGRFTNVSIEKSFGQLLDEQTAAIAEEEMDGRKVVAISGASKQGNITVWVDPEAGYAPVKCRIEKVVGQHQNGLGTGPFAPAPLGDVKARRWTLTMDNIKLEEIQGARLPVSAEVVEIGELEDGRTDSTKTSIRLSDFNLNPNFDAADAFRLSDIPNGTVVTIINENYRGQSGFEWQNGEIVARVSNSSLEKIDKTVAQAKSGATGQADDNQGMKAPGTAVQGAAGNENRTATGTTKRAAIYLIAAGIGLAAVAVLLISRSRKMSGRKAGNS